MKIVFLCSSPTVNDIQIDCVKYEGNWQSRITFKRYEMEFILEMTMN